MAEVTYYYCEGCGRPLPNDVAFAQMESLEARCVDCLKGLLKPCEECGVAMLASAYQHLLTGRVVCEPCVLTLLGLTHR